ncbi:MAG: thioredoxin fold domain-containing protein, partial [Acidobacteriota bacterium]
MEAEVYPNERVASFVNGSFIPVKIHIKEQPESFERFGAQWTPTAIILDSEGKEQHRFEGFLPADDFLAQLELGLARLAFSHQDFGDAEKRYKSIVERFPDSESAPEALYWAGVSRYKATNDASALQKTGEQFKSRYSNS